MQNFKSIPPALARECFDYLPESGELVWRSRPSKPRFVNTRYAGKIAGHLHTCTVGKQYVQVRVNNEMHYAHRIAWVLVNGPIPEGMQVDHINGNGADNRLSNLRLVTSSGNKRNQRKLRTNTSGYTGVYFDAKRKRPWAARVWTGGKFLFLGSAETAEEAHAIRLRYNAANGFHENHGQDRPL